MWNNNDDDGRRRQYSVMLSTEVGITHICSESEMILVESHIAIVPFYNSFGVIFDWQRGQK